MNDITQLDAQMVLKNTQEDPNWYFKNVLGVKPWKLQRRIARAIRDNSEVSVRSCHGAGKSWLAAAIAHWFANAYIPSIVITTAPTDRQVRSILWKEIRLLYKNAKIPLGGKLLTQQLIYDDDWWLVGFTAPEYDPDRFQGFHEANILIIKDEACGISTQINEAIDGILSSQNSKCLEIGNPTDAASPFAESFKTPGIKKFKISAYDTPNFSYFDIVEADIANGDWEKKIDGRELPYPKLVTPQWVAKRYRRWGPDSTIYKSRVLADFPDEGEDTLIPLRHIEAASQRELKLSDPSVLGVDVARFGSDDTTIYHRRGDRVRLVKTYGKRDTAETTGEIIRAYKKYAANLVIVDSIGVGGGVVDQLVQFGIPVKGFNASEPAFKDDEYLNLRAQMYWELRERFELGQIDIDVDDEELASELSAIKFKFDNKGRVQIEKKEEMKRRGLNSPNRADAVAMAMFDGMPPKKSRAGVW